MAIPSTCQGSQYGQIDLKPFRKQLNEFEDIIDTGISNFRQMSKDIERWREDVIVGRQEFSEETEERILAGVRQWDETTRHNLKVVDEITAKLSIWSLRGSEELMLCSYGAEQLLTKWMRPRLTSAEGLRGISLSDEESMEIFEALRKKTARPILKPRRFGEEG